MRPLWRRLRRFARDTEGALLAEYALLGVLILVVCVTMVTALGPKIKVLYDPIIAAL